MEDASDELAEHLLDHGKSPFHRGLLAGASHMHLERNPVCGDEVHLQLRIDGPTVSASWFQGRGCLVSQAAASILCEAIDGRPLSVARDLEAEEMLSLIGIPLNPLRQNCGLLAFRALQRVLEKVADKPMNGGDAGAGKDGSE